jgi:hypothetical protein
MCADVRRAIAHIIATDAGFTPWALTQGVFPMLDRLTVTKPHGEKLSNVLHFMLAAAFGLMSLHAAVHILAQLV